jgi:hypothetical protein
MDLDLDLDLESLDLKTISLNSNTDSSISANNRGNLDGLNIRSSKPNLTISTSNNDLMPNMSSNDDLGDLGLSLLANKKKQRTESESSDNHLGSSNSNSESTSFFGNTTSFSGGSGGDGGGSGGGSSGGSSEVLGNNSFDSMTNIDLDKELNKLNLDDNSGSSGGMSGPGLPNFDSNNTSTSTSFPSNTPTNTTGNLYNSIPKTDNMSYEDIQKAKFDLLCKFERLRDKGVRVPKTFSMSSDYEEMQYEYDRLVHARKMTNSVKMQRQMLISFVTGAEFLNNKFDPFDLKLNDWSEHVHENINDYDDIFEELYEKYKGSAQMAPELRLMFTLAGSAFMYHLSNSMFKSSLPNMNDVMKQNPDLMKQFTDATMNSMGKQNPGFAGFMGNMMGSGGGSRGPEPPQYNPMSGPPFSNPSAPPRNEPDVPQDLDSLINNLSDDNREINLDNL